MENNVNSQVRNLPIFKHFSESEISNQVDSFRKGEKGLFWFIKLGFFAALAYATWVYVLPPVLQAIGQMLGIIASGILILFVIIAAPVIIKGLRQLTRFLHKTLIKNDPFGELANQKQLMIQNREKFRIAKGKISELKTECEIEASRNQKEAEKLQNDVLKGQERARKLKDAMDAMVAKDGPAAKGTDEYVNMNSDLLKVLSESQRISYQLEQDKDFVKKYGVRANVMMKFGQKLTMVETSMDIKILDFDATVEMLKKDYDFAEKSKNATTAAKDAMLFTTPWELDYAIDVVTNTISTDIAITSGNLKDIDSLTKNYNLDSDELYANLDTLASNIRGGGDIVPDAKSYKNPDYQFTSDDKQKSGSIGNLFD